MKCKNLAIYGFIAIVAVTRTSGFDFLSPPAIWKASIHLHRASSIARRAAFRELRMKGSNLQSRLADSTLLLEAASAIGVDPPWNAPKLVWSSAFRFWQSIIPLLHLGDECVPQDTCVNLSVLWWKAIAGDSTAYDLLPSATRWLVSPALRRLYPPLHHQSVAMRTAYLDALLVDALRPATAGERVRVVVLGAGFDTRFFRLVAPPRLSTPPPPQQQQKQQKQQQLSEDAPQALIPAADIDWIELDLPEVVAQKAAMLSSGLMAGEGQLVCPPPQRISAPDRTAKARAGEGARFELGCGRTRLSMNSA